MRIANPLIGILAFLSLLAVSEMKADAPVFLTATVSIGWVLRTNADGDGDPGLKVP